MSFAGKSNSKKQSHGSSDLMDNVTKAGTSRRGFFNSKKLVKLHEDSTHLDIGVHGSKQHAASPLAFKKFDSYNYQIQPHSADLSLEDDRADHSKGNNDEL